MNINKAIRKQEKAHKRFLLVLGFIFFILPIALFISRKINTFFLLYLGLIELLILVTAIVSVNSNYLYYNVEDYKLKLRFRRFGEKFNILCDKVVAVFAEGNEIDMELIILTSTRFRSKGIKPIDEYILKKYPYLAHNYYRIKKHKPENDYYYIIINKGGYHKYKLLDLIYRNCLQAYYSEETIEKIKEYRNI